MTYYVKHPTEEKWLAEDGWRKKPVPIIGVKALIRMLKRCEGIWHESHPLITTNYSS